MSKGMCALVGMAAAVATLLVASANAAVSINLVVASIPNDDVIPGMTIVLETYVTANAGELDNTIFGAINFDDRLVNSNAAGNWQNPLFSNQGALTCTTAFCVAFRQVNAAGSIAVDLTNFLLARTTFIADPSAVTPGVRLNFTWRTTPSTQRLDWFGITNAPGATQPVPEPTTAALLGVGLLGLAVAVRRHV